MATATIEKVKKKCKDIKACKGSPAFKGCGKNFVISKRNFEENKNSKDGFNHTCLKCKAKFETFKIELKKEAAEKEKADAKAKKEKKLLKAKEKAKQIAKEKQETEDRERLALEAEEQKKLDEEAEQAKADAKKATQEAEEAKKLALEAEETRLAEEAKEAEETRLAEEAQKVEDAERETQEAEEQAERDTLAEAAKRPEVTFDQIKQARAFGSKSEETIEKLTGLAKLEENVIVFLHSIMLHADPDDGLFSTKEDVQKDMCERFRVDGLATLKPFTWKATREGWIDCRKEQAGYDTVKDKPIKVTTHFNITNAGIEWYNLWIEEQGLPKPIVPKNLRIPKSVETERATQSVDGHLGSSIPGQVNTDFELALSEGQNDVNAEEMYINFLIDYKREHKCTFDELGEKIGVKGPVISLACGSKRYLSAAHYPAIAVLMNINKTPPVVFAKENTADISTKDVLNQTGISKQPALPSQYMASNNGSDILINAIAKATKQHEGALAKVEEAKLKVRICANKIAFLNLEFNQLV